MFVQRREAGRHCSGWTGVAESGSAFIGLWKFLTEKVNEKSFYVDSRE